MNIAILGCGNFGLALGNALSSQYNRIIFYSKFQEEIDSLKKKYLNYSFTTDLRLAMQDTDLIVVAIPIEYVTNTLFLVKECYSSGVILVASKGIDTKTKQFAYQMLENILPNVHYGILSGGTFARDMMDSRIMGATLATSSNLVSSTILKCFQNGIGL